VRRADDLVFDEDWRRGVLRIWIGDAPIGTAFCIAPRLALTCHHCLRDASGPVALRAAPVRGQGPVLPINEWRFPASPSGLDAALIRLGEDAPGHLALSTTKPPGFGELVAYGYPWEDPKQALVRIDLQLRGRKSFSYPPDYTLLDALALSGDPAAPGMSGGPVIDASAGVAVAMIVGGPDYDNRAIALPLWALADVGANFPAFQIAWASNRRNTIQSGWAMNDMRARRLCAYQIDAAIKKLTGHRYDRARTLRRDKLMAAAARFVNSSACAFAIVSEPNCGKTLATVYAATEFAERSLFLEAFLIDDVRRSLTDYLQASLEKAPDFAPGENVGALASALAAANCPLVVFVDGVNEIADDVSKAERWIAEAIENAQSIGAKLIVSCRADFWKGLEAVHDRFEIYDLGVFSPAEAKVVGRLYGIDERIADDLDRHPLMFKIVSELGLASVSATRDRRSALQAMIRRIIKLSPGVRDLERTFAACERIVRDLDESADSIPWNLAANQLGGSAVVDNLVEGGLFRRREQETVRFTFDQMLEAMRPALPSDQATLAQLWTRALQDERAAKRAAGEMARAAFASQQEIFSRHTEALVNGLEEHLREDVAPLVLEVRGLESLTNIIDSLYLDLPESYAPTAEGLIKQIFARVVECVKRGGGVLRPGGLSASIARLGVPEAWKFELLCELLPLCSDYLLRDKDLFDRGESARLVEAAESVDSIAGVLLRLATDHAAVIRRLALAKLDDARRLRGGEATVGSVLAAILRLSARVEFDDLFSLLLDAANLNAAQSLLSRVL
jgi:Trypsin-like peptidase domain